jgi:hypothetical protein
MKKEESPLTKVLYSAFADFSTANKQQADDFSDDDVCRAFKIFTSRLSTKTISIKPTFYP